MRKAVVYIHGKGGSPAEAAHYVPLCTGCDIIGFDYQSATPWEAAEEFPRLFDPIADMHASVILIANSIGAYFAMCALAEKPVEKALFVSPIVDMEQLIADMLQQTGASEAELQSRQEIPTGFGETLSWKYLCWVREHPIRWNTPTHILYAGRDHLTRRETALAFAARVGASLKVMENGEHWFHTEEQMQFLDKWLRSYF